VSAVPPFPAQPAGVPWPEADWPTGEPAPAVRAAVAELTDRCLADPDTYGRHLALVVVQGGRLVAETYGPTAGPDTDLVSWSMAKSVTHAAVGVAVRDGWLDMDAPAPVPGWAGDERSAITLDELLAMSDGLDFTEDYVDAGVSHVIEMLFGAGRADVAAYAAARPAAHAPGTRWNYSSGTTNVVARIVGDVVAARAGIDAADPAGRAAAMRTFLHDELFGPLGMRSADPRFDDAGTFIGSSFLYATARDFARFGLLHLRDGVWAERRLLPAGWCDHARSPAMAAVPAAEPFGYGRHWWLHDRWGFPGAFGAHGFEGQFTIVVPQADLVVVRLGKTPAEHRPALLPLLRAVVAAGVDAA
jgi:CubicO group peptidase (beta-lactamase class C family)